MSKQSAIDETLASAARYAQQFPGARVPRVPAKGLAVVTCMDARIDLYALLGLEPGDAHVIRNAGGVVGEGELRSLRSASGCSAPPRSR